MTPEKRAAAIAKMPGADRAAALVCMCRSCVCMWVCGCWGAEGMLVWQESMSAREQGAVLVSSTVH